MVKKILLTIISGILIISYFSAVPAVRAQGQGGQLRPIEEKVFNSVTMDCLDVKMKLSVVHQQDGLLRVNTGASLGDISDKLIAPLNSKIASESLDGADLIGAASSVREGREKFDISYQNYERSMNQLLKDDCQSRQHQFYKDLMEVQQLRNEVYASINQVNQSIDNYFTAFESFKHNYTTKDNYQLPESNDEK